MLTLTSTAVRRTFVGILMAAATVSIFADSPEKMIATGTDTETYEVMPTPDRGTPPNPQPVHTKLLIENGIYLLESIYLEEIAREKVYEFAFIMLPLKIEGATGSMVDPLAVI